jgi:uncharacterized protein (DUF488 family)
MKTSNFKIYKGDKGVAICIYPPLDWSGAKFPALEPSRKLFFERKAEHITQEEYEKGYRGEILSQLDPKNIYDQLKDQVILCWEAPGKFCHRRIVAKWIFENLGIEVPEWVPGDDDVPETKAKPLF